MNFNISVSPTPVQLGQAAANKIAELLRNAIEKKGSARIILSTGASQFETIDALIQSDVPWDKVEMFHLDEYVDLPESHIASFRKYLKERFVSKVSLKAAHFVDGEGDVEENIRALTEELRRAPVDVGVIGIGENAHIAFNDPPANFETDAAYMVVNLDERCKQQQVGEGWFATVDDVPKQAITMCVKQILACEHIVSSVPHAAKAEAVRNTLTSKVDPMIPATILKTHPNWNLFLDDASASGLFAL
ncbi:MAG: glucosamine-6-phosphate deaminase [Oscillospiraceae bacterium]|jgi:glucosamine-6-phosphate deaminase